MAQAAQNAAHQLAFDRAAGLWIQALHLRISTEGVFEPHEIEEIRSWMIACAHAMWGAGRGRDSALMLLRAYEGMGTNGLDLLRQAAERIMVSGYLDEGIEVSRKIAQTLGVNLPKSATVAALSLLWSRIRVRLRGFDFVPQEEQTLSHQSLLHADILASLSRGLALTNHILGANCSARYLHIALSLGETRRVMEALTFEANFAAAVSVNSSYVRRILDVVETQKDLCRDFSAEVFVHAAHGYVDYMSGEWARARENAQMAFQFWSHQTGTFWERTLMRLLMCWSTFYLGDIQRLAREIPAVIREANDRGDLLTLASMVSGLNNTAFLETQGSQEALARVEDVMSRWSHTGYHMQHYFALLAHVQAHLFAMDSAAAAACIRKDERDLKRSWLLRVPSVRHEYWHFCGNAAILEALSMPIGSQREAKLREAEDWANKSVQSPLTWVQGTGYALFGAIAHARGNSKTVAYLRQALNRFQVTQGDEGQQLANMARDFFASQGLRSEENWLSLLVPGFSI